MVIEELQITELGSIPMDWWYGNVQHLVDEKVIYKPMDGNHGNIHPKASDFLSDGIPFIMANALLNGRVNFAKCNFISKVQADKLQKGFSKTNDVLLTHKGTIGETAMVQDNLYPYIMLTPQVTFYRVKDVEKLDPSYLYYFFQSYNFQGILKKLSGGGTRAYIGISAQRKLPVYFPPIEEQRNIINILSTWEHAISRTRKLVKQLELRKSGLIQKLLTGKKRLPGFNGEWKKYEIGEIASQFTDKNSGNEVSVVLSCTKYDGLVRSLEYFGRKVYGDDLTKYKLVPRNYFAYATNHIEEGSIGYQNLIEAGLVSPMYTVFKTNKKVDDSYLFRLLKTDRMIYYYQSNMSGTVARRGGLRWSAFKEIIVNLPPIKEQQAIASLLDEADNEIKLQTVHLKSLKNQKKGLMQQLLTGKKRVNK